MAKIRRPRRALTAAEISSSPASEASAGLMGWFSRPRHSDAPASLDVLDWLLYLGILLVTLIGPFLYSRMTTENFLTPKEFTVKICLAFLAALFCTRFLYEGRISLARSKLDFPLFLFFALSLASVLWNYNVPSAIRDLRGSFLILMLVPLIINTVRTRWQFEGVLWVIVFAGIATAALGIMESYNLYFRLDPVQGWVFARDEIFSGKIDYSAYYIPLFPQLASKDYAMGSIVSTFGNRNYLGTFTMFTAFIPLAFYFYYNSWVMKVVSMGLYGIMLYGLYITRCRAALFGIVLGIAFMFLMLFIGDRSWRFVKRNQKFFVGVIGIFMLGFLLAVTTAKSKDMWDKIKLTFTMDRKVSNTYERAWVWYGTFQSFAHNPFKWVLGSGYGSFKHFFPLQEGETFSDDNKETFTEVTFRQTHNDWLQLVSELGLIGLGIFLWLCWRVFGGIYSSIKTDISSTENGELNGDHVLLIGLGAALVAQLAASIPDFPFHRIETALYAVIVLALVPVISESGFFKRPLTVDIVPVPLAAASGLGVMAVVAGLLAINFEVRSWKADILVRQADSYLQARSGPEMIVQAKNDLQRAIQIDPLPGDPYLKMSMILEMEGKGQEAIDWADRAWKNINFNARSTYHSVVFRKMHIYYHVLQDRKKALEQALLGQFLTCGEARSIYYFYIGKICMELGDLAKAEWALERAVKFTMFGSQAGANLAVVKATLQKWPEALSVAASVTAQINDTDPTMLDIIGISASNLGQRATAERALRKALEMNPTQPVYKRDLGVELLRANRVGEARPLLEDAFLSNALPASLRTEVEGLLASITSVQRNTGMSLMQQKRMPEAILVLRDLYAAKVLATATREELHNLLSSLGAFQAEANPQGTQGAPPSIPTPPTPPGTAAPGPVPAPVPVQEASTSATPAPAAGDSPTGNPSVGNPTAANPDASGSAADSPGIPTPPPGATAATVPPGTASQP